MEIRIKNQVIVFKKEMNIFDTRTKYICKYEKYFNTPKLSPNEHKIQNYFILFYFIFSFVNFVNKMK